MNIIERNYLQKLISSIGTLDIKVITGVRRSGKSKLLMQFYEYVISNIKDANIIYLDFNNIDYEEYLEYHKLNNYVKSKYKDGMKNFLFIDEVQMCKGFERTINSLHASEKYDIYITGSNAFLLSSDLATLFTGRTVEIKVQPFSYKEYLEYYKLDNIIDSFDKYVTEGGFAGSYLFNNNSMKYDYILNVYETIINRDLITRKKVKNEDILRKLSLFLMDNIGNVTSVKNISNMLNITTKISDKTISSYIDFLCQAYLFYSIPRYDIKGKKYLSSNKKLYLVDQSIRYACLGIKDMNYGRTYENIVALELIRRGYEVYVGTLNKKEVDFVALKRNEKIYIQVSDNISDDKTFEREVSPLLQINDAYPKILVARTKHDTYLYEGIKIFDIANWLVEK